MKFSWTSNPNNIDYYPDSVTKEDNNLGIVNKDNEKWELFKKQNSVKCKVFRDNIWKDI